MLQLGSHKGLSPAMVPLSRGFCSLHAYNIAVLLPRSCVATVTVWALPSSLATTKGIIIYFLFLQVLRCFSSLGQPLRFNVSVCSSNKQVVPFGNLRIKGYLHLPEAYRSLSRPSSPLSAQASTIRPYLLSSIRAISLLKKEMTRSYFQLLSEISFLMAIKP